MMEEYDDGYGSQTFTYKQQDMFMQPPLTAPASLDPTCHNPFLIPPQPSYCTTAYSDTYMSNNLTDDHQGPLFGSSLLGNMLSHEFEKMRSMDMMEDKALAASRSHSEAERRRRERINSHLTQLRSLLPSTTKTDKASLLAEVIQRVKDLKQQTSALSELHTVPSESDELTFETCNSQDGQLLIKASLCCDDRSDILQNLIRTFQALNLRTVKADITTLAGRMKYVVFIVGDPEQDGHRDDADHPFIKTVREAFRGVMGRPLRKDDKVLSPDASLRRRRFKGKTERVF